MKPPLQHETWKAMGEARGREKVRVAVDRLMEDLTVPKLMQLLKHVEAFEPEKQ